MPGIHTRKLGAGHVQKQPVQGSNIYEGLVTRNMTEPTYTTTVDGTGVAVHPQARMSAGGTPLRSDTPTFSARQPKGMLLRTTEGPTQVHTTPK